MMTQSAEVFVYLSSVGGVLWSPDDHFFLYIRLFCVHFKNVLSTQKLQRYSTMFFTEILPFSFYVQVYDAAQILLHACEVGVVIHYFPHICLYVSPPCFL